MILNFYCYLKNTNCKKPSWHKTPMTKRQHPKPKYKKCSLQPNTQNPQRKSQWHFIHLAFCLWHSDQTPYKAYPQITSVDTCSRSSPFLHYLPAFSWGRFISCSSRIRSHVAVIMCRYFTRIQRRFICLTLLYTQLFRCTGILEKCYKYFAVRLR